MFATRLTILMLATAALAGCGGGGGGSSAPPPATGGPPPSPPPAAPPPSGDPAEPLVFTVNNSTPAATGFVANAAIALQLGHVTARLARNALLEQAFSAAGSCASIGGYTLTATDNGDGVLSGGDRIDIDYVSCATEFMTGTISGSVRLELEQVDTAEAGIRQFFGLVSSPGFDDARFRLGYVTRADAESIYVREDEGAAPLGGENGLLSNFNLRFEIGRDRRLLWMDATVQDNALAGTYRCETTKPFRAAADANPRNGTLSCTGGGDTRIRLVTNMLDEVVQRSTDGGASFSQVGAFDWPTGYYARPIEDRYRPGPLYPSAPNRLVDLKTVQVAAVPTNSRIFAITRTASPTAPNALVAIDPATGSIVARVPYGEEPAALAISRDGGTVYVGLDSTGDVYKYDSSDLSLLDTIDLGSVPGDPGRIYKAVNIAIAPNDPNTFVVSADRNSSDRETLLVRNGTVQPRSLRDDDTGDRLMIAATGDRLYGVDTNTTGPRFFTIDILADGLEAVSETPELTNMRLPPVLLDGIVYASDGVAVDAEALRPTGRFELPRYNVIRRSDRFPPGGGGSLRGYRIPLPDRDDAKIRFGYAGKIVTYDLDTYALLSAYEVGEVELWHSFVEAGGGYLAYAGLESMRIVDKGMLTDQPQPCAPSQTEAPVSGQRLLQLRCNFGDAAYSAANDRIYATLRGQTVGDGNALLEIDPSTLEVLRRLDVGSVPGTLSVSDSGNTAWIGLDGSRELLGVDLPSWTVRFRASMPNTRFDGILRPSDVEAVPGSDENVVVSLLKFLEPPRAGGLTSYQGGVEVTGDGIQFGAPESQEIEFGDRADQIIGIEIDNSRNRQVSTADLTPNGIFNHVFRGLIEAEGSSDVESVGGLLYFSSGQVADANTLEPLQPFDLAGIDEVDGAIGVDTDGDRTYIYFTQSDATAGAGIQRFVTSTRERDGLFEAPLLDQSEAATVQLITPADGATILVTDHYMLRVEPDAFR